MNNGQVDPKTALDVLVIGAGVVGCAIARELSRYNLDLALVDKNDDVCEGTSKGNSAIFHTGFDAKPGTLEARLVTEGNALLREAAPELGIPFEDIGALVVARTAEEAAQIGPILKKARGNGVHDVRRLDQHELYALEPHLAQGALGAVQVDREAIICPFTTPLAYATQAQANGVRVILNAGVTSIQAAGDSVHAVHTSRGVLYTRYIVAAAGLFGDKVDGCLGISDFQIKPRRGQFIVFDKHARRLVNHILLQVPTPRTKGILISPTIFGNVLLGPTAEDIDDPMDTSVTAEGLENIRTAGKRVIPELIAEDITTLYAGNRAATQFADYQIRGFGDRRYVSVGGIRSTGLSSALGIARYVVEMLRDIKLACVEKADFKSIKMPNLSEFAPRPYQQPDLIRKHPRYGRVVCFCERVSEQEVIDAIHSPVGAHSLSAVRRRTRATMGRCQGFNCHSTVLRLLDREATH